MTIGQQRMLPSREAGKGSRGEQVPLLHFDWGSRGSKIALLEMQ